MKRSFINCVMAAALIVAAIPVWGSKPLAVKAGKEAVSLPKIELPVKRAASIKADNASGLVAEFSCYTSDAYSPTWSENFDAGIGEWNIEGTDDVAWIVQKITGTGKNFADTDPDDVQSLYVDGPYQIFKRAKAKATSPLIKVPANGSLEVYVGFSQNMDDYCRLSLTISTDEFATEQELWNSADETGELSWRWHHVIVSLEEYVGKSVQLRFTYGPGKDDMFNLGGYMGDFAIDGMKILGISTIDGISLKTGEIVRFADLSSGEPAEWHWTFPGATPSESTEREPQVFYTRDGHYDVTLTVSNAEGTDTKTRTAFVEVVGSAPVAKIIPPATFRNAENHYPLVAPMAKVQFADGSSNFPTSRSWAFSGVDPEPYAVFESTDECPVVQYSYQHNQAVTLHVENEHGASDDAINVSAEYYAAINNLEADDRAATFDLDGRGTFPGTNSMKITAYAEKFSKPSCPMVVYAAYVYFVTAEAKALTDQISDVGVHLYTSENGLPGKRIESTWWRVFELDLPSGGYLQPTEFEFTPTVIDDEFFVVIDGIPEKNDSVDVSFAMADFRDHGNTAYMLKDGEWREVSSYFPAGANHTSFYVTLSMGHSVMMPLPMGAEGTVTVGKDAGKVDFPFFSLLGYKTPVASSDDWCSVVNTPNNLTSDTLEIAYDRLPAGLEQREAVLTVTDGFTSYDIHVVQRADYESGVAAIETSAISVCPSMVSDGFSIVGLNERAAVNVVDLNGRTVFADNVGPDARIDAANWAAGMYIVKVTTSTATITRRIVKR